MAALLGSPAPGDAGGAGDAYTTRVWGAAHVLMSVLLGNSVCQEIAAATPLELPMSSAPPDYFLQTLLQASPLLPPDAPAVSLPCLFSSSSDSDSDSDSDSNFVRCSPSPCSFFQLLVELVCRALPPSSSPHSLPPSIPFPPPLISSCLLPSPSLLSQSLPISPSHLSSHLLLPRPRLPHLLPHLLPTSLPLRLPS
eukprot:447978-Hanusia_phi.AAC.1